MDLNFDFLKSVKITEEAKPKTTKANKYENPTGFIGIRVYKNTNKDGELTGKVFPSKELVDALNMQYAEKDAQNKGTALDVFKSMDWGQFPQEADSHFVFVAPVLRGEPRVDLFASCSYDEAGKPKSDVMTQGGGSYANVLVAMVSEVYGLNIPDGSFVDFEIKTDIVLAAPNGVTFYPKLVTGGKKKGELTYQRRDNSKAYPLAPINVPDEYLAANVVEENEKEESAPSTDAPQTEPSPEDTSAPTEESAPAPQNDVAPAMRNDNPFEGNEAAADMAAPAPAAPVAPTTTRNTIAAPAAPAAPAPPSL